MYYTYTQIVINTPRSILLITTHFLFFYALTLVHGKLIFSSSFFFKYKDSMIILSVRCPKNARLAEFVILHVVAILFSYTAIFVCHYIAVWKSDGENHPCNRYLTY